MGVEWIVLVVFFVGFIGWSLLSGSMTKGKGGSVTREPQTLHAKPGYGSATEGPVVDKAATNATQVESTSTSAQNML